VAAGPYGGVHVHESHGVATSGAFGAAAVSTHHGVAVGAGGGSVEAHRVTVGGAGGVRASGTSYFRATSAAGRSYTYVDRTGLTAGPYGGVHVHESHRVATGPLGTASYHRVAVSHYGGGRAVAVSHTTHYVGATTLHTRAVTVRRGFYGRTFTAGWYGVHRAAWRPARWRVASFWAAPAWPGVARFCGITAPPVSYDYGNNTVINDGSVYHDGEQVAPAADYAGQALAMADTGRQAQPAGDEEWQPLGVFGLIQGEEQTAQTVFQLAVNKAGVVRGNYYDRVADNNLTVYGSLDPTTQRVAWSVGGKNTVVFEAGLQNLTQAETTVLVHYGSDRTRQMALVRLEQPQDGQAQPEDAGQ
jgi:hypothetical protein